MGLQTYSEAIQMAWQQALPLALSASLRQNTQAQHPLQQGHVVIIALSSAGFITFYSLSFVSTLHTR